MPRRDSGHKIDISIQPTIPKRISLANSWQLLGLFSLGFLILIGVTVKVQVEAGPEASLQAELNIAKSGDTLTPARGLFYDRNGARLVSNVDSFTLLIKKSSYDQKSFSQFLTSLGKLIKVDTESLTAKFGDTKDAQITIASGLTNDDRIRLETLTDKFKFTLRTDSYRDYRFGSALAQVLGYTGLASVQDLANGLAPQDQVGKYRLEKIYDKELRGVPGYITDETRQPVADVPGNNIVLTIDYKWQLALNDILARQVNALGGAGGAAVIVDISNGNLLADVSYPSFNPNLFAKGISNADYKKLLEDPRKPLIDKAVSTQTAPGSTFKLLAAYTLLQNHIIDANTHIFSNGCIQLGVGYPFCEYGKFHLGDLEITRALARSSNIFFCENVLKLAREKSFDVYVNAARALGIGQRTGIDLDGEVAGVLASPEYKERVSKEPWFEGDICNGIIGQGYTVVTPLQMAMVVATIMNGGNYYKPNVVSQIVTQDGKVVKSDFTEVLRKVPVSEETKSLITAGMQRTVQSFEGTAYRYLHNAPGNFIAKSGSAESFAYEKGKLVSKVNGWIVGTFEYKGKKYAYAATITNGGGGWNVTQVMQRFAHCLFNNFYPQCTTAL